LIEAEESILFWCISALLLAFIELSTAALSPRKCD